MATPIRFFAQRGFAGAATCQAITVSLQTSMLGVTGRRSGPVPPPPKVKTP